MKNNVPGLYSFLGISKCLTLHFTGVKKIPRSKKVRKIYDFITEKIMFGINRLS